METMEFNHTTEEQNKIIALLLHLDEDFFVLEDEESQTAYIFEGERDDVWSDFESNIEGTDDPAIDANFLIYCQNNLSKIDEINDDYLVLTDDEADERTKEYILDSVWAFNPWFLASETGIDQEVFEAIQANDRCERNNDAILRLIEDEDSFVKSAISADGRGHFMSSYDGYEHEENVNGVTYYIYRMN